MDYGELEELYCETEEEHIPVLNLSLPTSFSMSVRDERGRMAIGMDIFGITTLEEQKVRLAHELGHCKTLSFYNHAGPCDLRGKHERRANRWAVHRLVPYGDLRNAIRGGTTELWELAEEFHVTVDFMHVVHEQYEREYGPGHFGADLSSEEDVLVDNEP